MLMPYLVLGLPPTASRQEIRKRYLTLIRAHPPSREPDRAQQIMTAWEALSDERSRVHSTLYGVGQYKDCELALDALLKARGERHLTTGLQSLLVAEGLRDD